MVADAEALSVKRPVNFGVAFGVVAVRKTHPVLGQSDRIWYLDQDSKHGPNTIMQAMGAFACISVRWSANVPNSS